jgi:hypothetical protein
VADWTAIEAALKAWLSSATGVPANKVIFDHQKTPVLADGAFVTLKIRPPRKIGQDEVQYPTDLGASTGQEVQQTITGAREFVVSVQAYTVQAIGSGTAKELLSKAEISLSKPSQVDAFNAAGISYFTSEPMNDLPVLGQPGQGRAQIDLRFMLFEQVVDPVGYIDRMGTAPGGGKYPTGTFS